MPFSTSAEIEINKPLGTVIRFVFEPTNEPFWITGVLESHMLSVRPIGRGTQVQRIQKIQGNTIEYVYELTKFDPEGIMSFISLNSQVSLKVEYVLKKLSDDMTLFRQVVKGSNNGITRIFDLFTERSVRKILQRDMSHLKQLLEQSG